MTDFYPPWHPYWDAVMDGYAAGLQHGIEMGRAQIEAEEHPIWAAIIASVNRGAGDLARRAGPIGHAERQAWLRQRAEDRTQHPGWTIEQIREHAHRSWGLPYPPAPQSPAPSRTAGQGPGKPAPTMRTVGGRAGAGLQRGEHRSHERATDPTSGRRPAREPTLPRR
jgi:hypothetical protein